MSENNRQSEQGAAVQAAPAPEHDVTGGHDMPSPNSTKFAAFQFYPRDFLTSDKVARMSLTEVGIYITLLSYAWLGNGLPSDLQQVAKLARIPAPRFKKLWAGVLSECFVLRGTKFINPRQEQQRKELQSYVDKCQRGGEKSAETRRKRYGTAQPASKHLPRELRSDAEVTPNTASASASAEKETRLAPLVTPPKKQANVAYFTEIGVNVIRSQHEEFRQRLQNADGLTPQRAEERLMAWYRETELRFASTAIGESSFEFWGARFKEWQGRTASKPKDTGPQYVSASEHPYSKAVNS